MSFFCIVSFETFEKANSITVYLNKGIGDTPLKLATQSQYFKALN